MSALLDCPFCCRPFGLDRHVNLFSLGFQTLGICLECLQDVANGHTPHRWREDTCVRCSWGGRVYWSAPDKLLGMGGAGICERCVRAGVGHMTNTEPLPEPKKPPRRLTKAEQSSGNS